MGLVLGDLSEDRSRRENGRWNLGGMVHDNITEALSGTRCRQATVTISNGAATLSIGGNQTNRAWFVGREFAVVMQVVLMVSGGSLGADIIMCPRSIVIKLVKQFKLGNGGRDGVGFKGKLIE